MSPESIGVRIRGFHLSKTILPPRPILPWKWNERVDVPWGVDGSDGGMIPAAANLSGSSGFVNSRTGSFGSCINTRNNWLDNYIEDAHQQAHKNASLHASNKLSKIRTSYPQKHHTKNFHITQVAYLDFYKAS